MLIKAVDFEPFYTKLPQHTSAHIHSINYLTSNKCPTLNYNTSNACPTSLALLKATLRGNVSSATCRFFPRSTPW
jgi:hypothetical protein